MHTPFRPRPATIHLRRCRRIPRAVAAGRGSWIWVGAKRGARHEIICGDEHFPRIAFLLANVRADDRQSNGAVIVRGRQHEQPAAWPACSCPLLWVEIETNGHLTAPWDVLAPAHRFSFPTGVPVETSAWMSLPGNAGHGLLEGVPASFDFPGFVALGFRRRAVRPSPGMRRNRPVAPDDLYCRFCGSALPFLTALSYDRNPNRVVTKNSRRTPLRGYLERIFGKSGSFLILFRILKLRLSVVYVGPQPARHLLDRRNLYPSLAGRSIIFIILAQPSAAS